MAAISRPYKAGESLEDFCRACKTDRMHTVVAADADGRPLRVACGYCRSEHNYRGGPRVDPSVFTDFSDIFGGSMGDLFGELFGMGGGFGGGGRTRRQGRGERGSNLLYRLEISFPEAVHGTEKTVRIPRLETCSRCGGRGAESEKGVRSLLAPRYSLLPQPRAARGHAVRYSSRYIRISSKK